MKSNATVFKQLIRILLAISLVLAITVSSVILYSLGLLGNIRYTAPAAAPTAIQNQPQALRSPMQTSAISSPVPEEIGNETGNSKKTSSLITLLLIGKDQEEGTGAVRSDSMILCTFDKETNTLTMTSVLRDLYVPIPGHRNNRINAAYACGGMSLLKQTMEQNFGIQIHGTIEVDFTHFANIIDLLGGVTLELRQDEADYINGVCNSDLAAGKQQLTGSQALAYARIRKLDKNGDFSRTDRQRKLLKSLLDSYKTAGLSELLAVLEAVFPMVSTDLTLMQTLELVLKIAPGLSSVTLVTQCVPAEGTYVYQNIRGMSVLMADLDAARELLQKTAGKKTG